MKPLLHGTGPGLRELGLGAKLGRSMRPSKDYKDKGETGD
jgi:hypothetical protein